MVRKNIMVYQVTNCLVGGKFVVTKELLRGGLNNGIGEENGLFEGRRLSARD